jgi:3-dehydroquinate synthase
LQIPTSLLAQVDSSVGGKVGINLPEAKNIVGAVLQPLGVLIDITALSTLAANQYRAGLAEVVKYGVILDAEFFSYLEAEADALLDRQEKSLSHVVARCCRLKADVVERDEREESGLRAALNFGHTFGHAFELLSWQVSPLAKGEVTAAGALLHGEAVAAGMVCAARLAERVGRVDGRFTQRLCCLLRRFGLPVEPPGRDVQEVLDAMSYDKKAQAGRLRFVLPTRLGHVELVDDISSDNVLAVLEGG